jgi:glucose-1-phosphate adenylyltransferase
MFIKRNNPDLVLILSGDHIYTMSYDAMVAFHLDRQADLTIATIRVPESEASRYGILSVDGDQRITSFLEKPKQPPSNLANMGVYLFNAKLLDRALWEDHTRSDSSHDFGKDILPRLVAEGKRIFAYPYEGYWVDVGTVESYWQAHMDLLSSPPPIDLNDRSWIIHTRTEERPPVRISNGAVILDSMITDGCVIEAGAKIERSVLSPGVSIAAGALVHESVILTDTAIEKGVIIEHAIIDKRVRVCESARVGAAMPGAEPLITMIGKSSYVPSGMVVEPGAIIGPDVIEADYSSQVVRGSDYIQTRRLPYET